MSSPFDGAAFLLTDETYAGTVVEGALRSEGFQFVHIDNGFAFMSAAHRYKPRLLIIDVVMRWASPLELCKQIKQSERYPDAKIIFLLPENADASFIAQCREAGADDHLIAPFKLSEILEKITFNDKTRVAIDEGDA